MVKSILSILSLAVLLSTAGCNRSPQTAAGQRSAEDGDAAQQTSDLKPADIAQLEAAVAKDPEKMFNRAKLLAFYANEGDKVMGPETTREARRRHILWLVEHHPENKNTRAWTARIFTQPDDRDPDPEGYAEGRRLWLLAAEKPNAPVSVLTGASRFLRVNDKPLAEKMMLRARALDPKGRWSSELGHLYYEAMVGATALTPQGTVRTVSLAEAHNAFAKEARTKLANSNDAAELIGAGEPLSTWGRALAADHRIDFDPVALAKTYVAKAVKLDPQSLIGHQVSNVIRFEDRGGQLMTIPQGSTPEDQYTALGSVPEDQRYIRLALLAQASYSLGDPAAKKDPVTARSARDTARKCAEESLRIAEKFRNDPDYGTAVFDDNTILGLVALASGNRNGAVHYMMEAAKAPATEELMYSSTEYTLKLAEALYREGERNTVADFLERFGQTNQSEQGYILESAKAIRGGKNPLWVMKK